MKVTKVTTVVTNIIMALLAILCICITYRQWSDDTPSNIGVLIAMAIVLGGAKIAQAVILLIARGIDGVPMLFKK